MFGNIHRQLKLFKKFYLNKRAADGPVPETDFRVLGSFVRRQKISTITTESSWKSTDISARIKPHVLVARGITQA